MSLAVSPSSYLVVSRSILAGLVFVGVSSLSQASTPSEMAEMSLQDLFTYTLEDEVLSHQNLQSWDFGIVYKRQRFEGYQSGTDKLSNNDVLFVPGDTRTDENYPILPTVISQEAVVVQFAYQLDDSSSLSLGIPYIRQSTDHISSVPGYDTFEIESQGVGDIYLNYQRTFYQNAQHQWRWTLGLSAPTGSIDEKGDTPRGPGNQQLPYTMQLGSGTWDFPLAIHYQYSGETTVWGANVQARVRSGENDRDYRLGNRLTVNGWGRRCLEVGLCVTARLSYVHWQDIRGQDDSIVIPSSNPYPANITDPDNYGGDKVNLALGLEMPWQNNLLVMELGAPLIQDLNGVQTRENFSVSLGWNVALQ